VNSGKICGHKEKVDIKQTRLGKNCDGPKGEVKSLALVYLGHYYFSGSCLGFMFLSRWTVFDSDGAFSVGISQPLISAEPG
jgi:hypothetical protein